MEYILYSFIWWQILSITVVSSGYHRYFSHKSFNAPIWYEWYVLILGSLTGGGPLLGWAGVHRLHHKHSDTEHDPHAPKHVGFWKVVTSTFKVPHIERRFIRDLLRNPRVMWAYRYHKYLRLAAFSLVLVLPLEWFFVFVLSPMIYGYIGFGLINAFAHTKDGARNSHLINIFAGGDGFHKNHHERPSDWQIGKKWYELDPGAWFIRMIKKDD